MADETTTPRDAEGVREPENALPEVRAADLPEALRAAVERAGWPELMPVQARAIPYIRDGRNLMVQSRTGSGKTGAFVLPLLELVDPSVNACQALILTPTRELARQVATEAEMLAGPDGPRVVSVYGGVAYGPQIEGFKKGAHIVVGTPGRVLDHLLKRSLSLKELRIFILDEADRMLSMGFYPDMKEIQSYLPKGLGNVQMFSATFPPYVLRLAEQFLTEPSVLSLSADHVHVTEIEHVYCVVPGMGRDRALVRLIEIENPSAAIIFCNTRNSVHFVTAVLQRFGYDADEISSDLAQSAREKVLGRVREGTLRFLVATDVAARGIDIPELSHVIQYEPPEDPESYVHRAGRTGRAGASGEAITLVDSMEQIEITRIGKRFSIEFIERPVPTDEDVARIVSERTTALLEARLRARDTLQQERLERFLPLARSLSESEDELRLLAMLLDEAYQQSLHQPQAHPAPEEAAAGGSGGKGEKGGKGRTSGGKPRAAAKKGSGRGRGGRRSGGRRTS